MEKNTGRDYEILTKLILQQAYELDGVKNLRVAHDIVLQGAILPHQIDVYLSFDVGTITYATIVQCKDWNSRVKQEQMMAFSQVLADLPGQPRGVFVTRKGYQDGARKLAQDKGIILYTLREPTEKDWHDLAIIRSIVFELIITVPRISNHRPVFDYDWWLMEQRRIGLREGEASNFHVNASPQEVEFYHEDKTPSGQTLYDLEMALTPRGPDVAPQCVIHLFNEPTYIRNNGDPRVPYLGLKSVSFEVEVFVGRSQHKTDVQSDDIAAYIMRDVLSGKTSLVNRELRLRIVREGGVP